MNFNEDYAYWLGLVQADGFISKFMLKGKTRIQYEFGLETISEVLINEFSKGLQNILGRKVSILKTKRNTYKCKISSNTLIEKLESMNIKFRNKYYNPTPKIAEENVLFGAYLAGIIDGDGDVRIKRPKYPQCVIRIGSGSLQQVLNNLIKEKLKCSVLETHREVLRNGKTMQWYEMEFLVSSKNTLFIKDFVLPYIKLDYKKDRIQRFICKAVVV